MTRHQQQTAPPYPPGFTPPAERQWAYAQVKLAKLAEDSREPIIDRVTDEGHHLLMYLSEGEDDNDNGEFFDRFDQAVLCRHLADHFMRHHKRQSATPYHRLQPRLPDDLWHNRYDKHNREAHADHYTLFNAHRNPLGEILQQKMQGMQPGDSKHFLLHSVCP